MTNTVLSYPIPAYQNVPIQANYFQPSQFVISGISLGSVTTVTTTLDINYVIGQEVRLLIPPSFGSIQLNNVTAYVIDIPASNQVTLDINSSVNVDAYISSTDTTQSAQILAIGDINSGITSSTGRNIPTTNIPGAFINISPQ